MKDIEQALLSCKSVVPGMSYKATRKMLLTIIGKDAARHEPTKRLVEVISRGAVEAFNMGKRDGEWGAAKQPRPPLVGSELQNTVLEFVNFAYFHGYEVGKLTRPGGET